MEPLVSEPPTLDYRSDEQLFAAMNRGDGSAFETFYARYRDFVHNLAWRFTGHQADALDALQATFEHLLQKIPNLTLSAKATTYLYTIVRSIAVSHIRQRRRAGSLSEREEASLTAPPAATPESLADLAVVLRRLPEAQREVVLMRYVDDMPLEDIAVALGIPLGTVKSRLHHALATLRADERTRRYFLD